MDDILPIIGHKGYMICNNGIVLSPWGKVLKPRIRKNTGYFSVVLYRPKKSYLIHRLVALHFIPNPQNFSQVDHLDGDKSNNHYLNLEWVTPSKNIKRSYKNGFHKPTRGKSSLCIPLERSKTTIKENFESFNNATRKTGYSRALIHKFINQSRKDPEGFSWCKI